jgi:hypothetical protein
MWTLRLCSFDALAAPLPLHMPLRACSTGPLPQHPHHASWQRLAALPCSSHARREVVRLARLTATSSDRALLLQPSKDTCTMWKAILKHRVRIDDYGHLLRMHLEELRQTMPQEAFSALEGRIRLEPFLGAHHIAAALSSDNTNAPQAAIDDEILNNCTTLIRAAQAIRKRQLTPASWSEPLTPGHTAVGEPRVSLGPAAYRRLWCMAQTDALELMLPSDRSVELLDWVAQRVVLRHKRATPQPVLIRLIHERALAYGAFGDWNRALSIVVEESGSLPHTLVLDHQNFIKCCRVQCSWKSALLTSSTLTPHYSVEDVVQFAPSWEHAARAASHHVQRQNVLGLPAKTTPALLLADVLTKRSDVSWEVAIQCIGQCVSASVVPPAALGEEKRLLVRVLSVLAEKTSYPFCSRATCELVLSAVSSESARESTVHKQQLSASLYRDGRVALAQSVSLCSQGRWDLAVGLLSAAAHQDIASAVHGFFRHTLREQQLSVRWPPVPLSAYQEVVGTMGNRCELPLPPSTRLPTADAILYDARVLAVCLKRQWIVKSFQLVWFVDLPLLTTVDCTTTTIVVLDYVSPRTTSLISSLQFPMNPFSALHPACFVFQHHRKTLGLLHATTFQERAKFRKWVATQGDETPVEATLRRQLWATLRSHVEGTDLMLSASDNNTTVQPPSFNYSRINVGGELKLEQISTTPLQFSEARRTLRRITNGRDSVPPTTPTRSSGANIVKVNTVDDWHGFLMLVALSSARRKPLAAQIIAAPAAANQPSPPRHSDGAEFTFVGCEGRLLRSAAALYACGAVSSHLPLIARDVGILTMLSATRSDDISVSTISAIISMWPTEEIKKFPMAACLAGYARSLEGHWEAALQFLDPNARVLRPTGVYSYDALMTALRLHMGGGVIDLRLSWALTWMECALTIPNRNVSMLVARYAMSQFTDAASSPLRQQASDVGRLFRILRAAWSLSPSNDAIARLVGLDDAVASGRRLSTNESLRLSAALCLVNTKQQLLPLASRVGRPLGAEELRPVACRRVLSVLPWETALSFFVEAHDHNRVDCDALVSLLGRISIPDAVLHQVAQFAAARGMTRAAALAEGMHLLRSHDVVSLRRGVVLMTQSIVGGQSAAAAGVGQSSRLGPVGMLLLAERATRATLLHSPSFVTAAITQALQDTCRYVCDKEDPLWLRDWRRSCDVTRGDGREASEMDTVGSHRSQLSPLSSHDNVGVIKPILMTAFVALQLGHAKQHPVPASLKASALRLASSHGEWGAALYFFSQLRKPRSDEVVLLATSLTSVHWRIALRVYANHVRLLSARPDAMCAALLGAVAAAKRMVGIAASDPSRDDTAPNDVADVALRILDHPFSVKARIRDLASAHSELRRVLLLSSSHVGDDVDDDAAAEVVDGAVARHRKAFTMSSALVGDFSSHVAVWKTAIAILSRAEISDPLLAKSVEFHHDIRECLIGPVERAGASRVASALLKLEGIHSAGRDNVSRLQLCAAEDDDDDQNGGCGGHQ